jgi:hypothetical protein
VVDYFRIFKDNGYFHNIPLLACIPPIIGKTILIPPMIGIKNRPIITKDKTKQTKK